MTYTIKLALDNCEKAAIESGAHESYKIVRESFAELRDSISTQQTRYNMLRAIVESAALPHCLEDEECRECLSCKARIALNQIKELA